MIVDDSANAFPFLTGQYTPEHYAAMHDKRRAVNVSHQPVAERLVRLMEELLEREDALPAVDLRWYRNKLEEAKKELRDGNVGGVEESAAEVQREE